MITGSLIRCDLLKKLYLCGVNYNSATHKEGHVIVVICLKSCIFVVSITTLFVEFGLFYWL